MGSGGGFERRLHRFEKMFVFFVVEKIESVERMKNKDRRRKNDGVYNRIGRPVLRERLFVERTNLFRFGINMK
jgi:hypothetical protein